MTSTRDLTLRLADLLRREHAALSDFLVALADFDRARRWLELGHASLFFQLSKREAKAVSAEIRPCVAAPHRVVVTPVRAPAAAPALLPPSPSSEVLVHPDEPARTTAAVRSEGSARTVPVVHPDEPPDATPDQGSAVPAAPPRPQPRRDQVEPLTADLRRLQMTVSSESLKKPGSARAALSHSHPGAGAEEILEAGLDLLLDRHAKRRGLVEKPRREPPPSKTDHVPAHVKRAVWVRDGGRCQWKLASGGICGSTHRVELDHVFPRGRGGLSTIDGMRLLCKVHNDLAAREVYGDAWMDRFTGGRGGSVREAVEPWAVGSKGAPRAAPPWG